MQLGGASKKVEQKGKEIEGQLKYEVTAIRTTETNQQTGAYNCAADLAITDPSGIFSTTNGWKDTEAIKVAVKYSVEITDNHDQVIVTILDAQGENTHGQDLVKAWYSQQKK
jgi:hypothetical protein